LATPLPVFGKGSLLDTVALKGHNRTVRPILGLLVGNNKKGMGPPSKHYFGYNLNVLDVPYGNANALHTHKTLEWFMSFSGDFEIRAGQEGHARLRLAKWDTILVPPFVKRSFKCVSDKEHQHFCEEMREDGPCGMIMVGLVAEAWVQWAKETVQQARANGVRCTDSGLLYDEGTSPPHQTQVAEKDCTQEFLESCVLRAEDGASVTHPYGDGDMRFEYVSVGGEGDGSRSEWVADGDRNYAIFILDGPPLQIKGSLSAAACHEDSLGVGEVAILPKQEDMFSLCSREGETTRTFMFVMSASMTEASYPTSVLDIL